MILYKYTFDFDAHYIWNFFLLKWDQTQPGLWYDEFVTVEQL